MSDSLRLTTTFARCVASCVVFVYDGDVVAENCDICDAEMDTHTYVQIYIAPKIVRTNLRDWYRMTRGKGRLVEMEFLVAFKGG